MQHLSFCRDSARPSHHTSTVTFSRSFPPALQTKLKMSTDTKEGTCSWLWAPVAWCILISCWNRASHVKVKHETLVSHHHSSTLLSLTPKHLDLWEKKHFPVYCTPQSCSVRWSNIFWTRFYAGKCPWAEGMHQFFSSSAKKSGRFSKRGIMQVFSSSWYFPVPSAGFWKIQCLLLAARAWKSLGRSLGKRRIAIHQRLSKSKVVSPSHTAASPWTLSTLHNAHI